MFRRDRRDVWPVNTREIDMFVKRPRKVAMVIGHSFIKDLQAYLQWAAGVDGFQPAIEANYLWQGTFNANKLRLNIRYSYVGTLWAYLWESPQMEYVLWKVKKIAPDTVLINIGSNEICEVMRNYAYQGDIVKFVYILVARARRLIHEGQVSNITFMTFIKRGAGYPGRLSDFEWYMNAFNSALTDRVSYERRMRVHKVIGFTELDPWQWAEDKMHPLRDWESPAFDRYIREIRAALYHAVAAIQDDDLHYGESG